MPSSANLLEVIRIQTDIVKSGPDLGTVMALVAHEAQRLTGASGAVVELAEGEDMVYRAACGIASSQLGLRINRSGSLSGRCVQERQILTCQDSETDPRVDRNACRQVGLRSMVTVPLNHAEHTVGVLKIVSANPAAFQAEHVELLGLMSELIAAAMANAVRFETNELYHRATHDELTGLANRSLFYDRMRQTLKLAERHAESFGVLNLDMDGLKAINDQFGHQAGDAAIRGFATRLRYACRQSDTVARMGGDEFGVILPRVRDRGDVERQCQRLATEVDQPLAHGQLELPLGASIGMAVFPDDGVLLEELLEKADQAMYQCKRQRKAGQSQPTRAEVAEG